MSGQLRKGCARNAAGGRRTKWFLCSLGVLVVGVASTLVARAESDPAKMCPGGNRAPRLTAFEAVCYSNHTWILTGSVEDEDVMGCTVRFSGRIEGSASVNSEGNFYKVIELSDSEWGVVSAQAFDQQGKGSNILEDLIVHY